ncbi:MAG: hypothetical protein PHF72_10345 [Gammaproteobacteria bacterium]|nr:hypothetical protein [Gammaproteobacteria bacterium]
MHPRLRPCHPAAGLLLVLLLVPGMASVWAVEGLELDLGALSGPAWEGRGIHARIAWDAAGRLTLAADMKALKLPPGLPRIDALELRCPDLHWTPAQVTCAEATVQLRSPDLDDPALPMTVTYRPENGEWRLQLRDTRFADGSIRGRFGGRGGHWSLELEAEEVAIERLLALSGPTLAAVRDFNPSGRFSGSLKAGGGSDAQPLTLSGQVRGLGYEDPQGLQVGQALRLALQLRVEPAGAGWAGSVTGRIDQGQIYSDPVFADFAQVPLGLRARGEWRPREGVLTLADFDLQQDGLLRAGGSARLDTTAAVPLRRLELTAESPDLGRAYPGYLQPFLLGTALDALEMGGGASVSLEMLGGRLAAVEATLKSVDIADGHGRFAAAGLAGRLAWAATGEPRRSRLSWESGQVYAVDLGAATLHLAAAGDRLELPEPFALPILDGRLQVDSLRVSGLGAPDPEVDFEGMLTPVSLEALTTALGWPEMSGKLSGMIPAVSYRAGVLGVDGALLVRVFDGSVVVRDLRLESPFGVVPRLSADVDLDNLDLDTLTRTFAFGNIQGRLGGRIHGLRLENWEPVAFDADFRTPPGDRSRHRISQRAVDNLTSLGGGVGGALSRSFLRMFESFSYDAIGLSCRLARGVCRMDGLEESNGGYTIVRGGGLPRIDVVGYSREVDWEVLVRRLRRITEQGPAVVE